MNQSLADGPINAIGVMAFLPENFMMFLQATISAGISSGQLYQWVRRYKNEGYDGLKLIKKGRPSEEPIMIKDDKTKKLTKSEKEELILLRKQIEYLRAENAYLKKLRALIVQKQTESSVKAKKQESLEDSEMKDSD